MPSDVGEILPGLWRFEAAHPEWSEEDGGDDGWDPVVAWWAIRTSRGMVLVDPLVTDWEALDLLTREHGGCAGIVRMIHWHQRSIAPTAERYGASVWARPLAGPHATSVAPADAPLDDGQELWDGIAAVSTDRLDEVALWLPAQGALVFADAMLRHPTDRLRVCPATWTQPEAGRARLLEILTGLTRHQAEHVLVSHGRVALGDGRAALPAAVAAG